MDTTRQYEPPPAPPSGADSFFDSLRRTGIWRTEDRWIGGVAAGTAHRLGVDPVLVRGVLVVMSFFGGLGLVLYGAGWALLPEARDGRIHLQEAVRGRFDAALAGAIALFVVGISRPVFWWDLPGAGWVVPWALALAALVAVVAITAGNRPTPPRPDAAAPGAPPPAPAAPAPDAATPATHAAAAAGTAVPAPGAAPADEPTRPAYDPGPATAPGARPAYDPGPATAPAQPWQPNDTVAFARDGGTPPPPPPPPVPPRPRVPGPSSRTVSLVLAVCLLAGAGILLAHYTDVLDGNLALVVGGSVLTLLGLGVLVSGMQGRRQGVLGGLAFLVALVMVPTATAVSVLPGVDRLGQPGTSVAGAPGFTPTSAAQAEEGYSLGAGDLTVDLTDLTGREDVDVPVDLGLGVARIVVPADADVEIRATLGGGEVLTDVGPDWSTVGTSAATARWDGGAGSLASGAGLDVVLRSEDASSATAPTINVDVAVGFGQIVIEERS